MTTSRAAALAAVILLAGCSVGPKLAAPVEPDKARAALRTALDAWKAGKPIGSLTEASPPIVAQDFDWLAGAKLDDYAVLDDKESDANLRVRVQLTVRPAQGAVAKKTVTYVVGTDPSLTVFRAME
ncbi:MAG TPA: hypothetical protein VD866_24355 [Urbifossiella sp.]|nr:hypothetical protein [Urbifossiella sp.]